MIEPSAETYRRILGLRAVRHFRPDPVPEEAIDQILEAGRWTGSAKNLQLWAFVVVVEPAQRAAVAEAGSFSQPLRDAPVVIVPVRLPGGYEFDTGRVAQNMMLAAAAIGVASVPITLHNEDVARAALGVPDDHGCRYALAMGYPDESAHRAARAGRPWPSGGRKPLGELVHRERFSV